MSDDWWTDYRQNRRIRELQGEVDAAYGYAASRSRALQSRLSQVQGTLERRLDRLARSFDAFVELSDIRLELAVFDREAAVRHRTRRLLMGLAQGATDPPPLGLDDCPGYWLKPAAEALSALVRGDVVAEKFTSEAIERDEDRTTLFLTLGLAAAGRYAEAVPWLSRSLPALGTTVTAVQRQLWIACADGAFGEPGREHIQRRLTELLDEMPAEAGEQQRANWRQAVSGGKKRASLPRELQNEKALTEPPLMATRLTMLRTRVEAALQPFDAAPASDFSGLLNTLVDEGAPEEQTLVARARELRQIIETGGTERPPAWDAPAGETLALLRGDMFERSAPGPRALAAKVGGRWLSSIADGLARRASVRPPDELDLRLSGHPLRVGPNGAPALAEAQAKIDRDAAISPAGERLGMAVGTVGVVVLVLTIAAGLPLLAVLAGLMIAVGAGIWIKLFVDRKKARTAAELDKDRLARQAATISGALKECHNSHIKLAEAAAADREAILTVLT
ncbi:hypothetical protein [Actinomadura sp. DC4]|uniref:hypothetical protein n=1 Tax=Actinomadura sp. DC4 TaxID=3055069 RepID=UPI0025AF9D2B|nr:hypothetical protein [Actinomadura sp. DC4]MDN3356735.1 hypothetical protein [Actinomadura sp. DC4]